MCVCACGEPQDLRGSHSQNNLLGVLSPGLGGWNPPFSGFHPPPCLDQPLPLLALVSQLSHEDQTPSWVSPAHHGPSLWVGVAGHAWGHGQHVCKMSPRCMHYAPTAPSQAVPLVSSGHCSENP